MNFKNTIFTIFVELIRMFKWIRCLIIYLFLRKKIIIVRAAVVTKCGGVKPFNWGDDINYYLLKLISGKKIVFLPHGVMSNILSLPCYLGIGSIVSFYNLDKTSIIGSGIISDKAFKDLKGKPSKIYFVRGPLTRSVLVKHGIACPEIYGDLALTLPVYYTPKVIKKDIFLGIVLHIADENLYSIQQIKKTYPEIRIIYMNKYLKWTDIIDEINSCEVIFSSALHGLITSEAYGICNQWISFKDKIASRWETGYEFKYKDFFASIEKKVTMPIEIDHTTNLYELAKKVKKNWTRNTFDVYKLIDALPDEFKH